MNKPTHAWLGRIEGCRCIMAVSIDDQERRAGFVADMLKDGLIPERVTWEEYLKATHEPGFFSCPHEKEKEQPRLFSE